MKFISRINKVFSPEFLDEMFDLYKKHKFYVKDKNGSDVLVNDVRHIKSLKFREKLTEYFKTKEDVAFNFLGDGTNRMAFLVDGYVFKLALDDQGYIDNLTEFKMSREAQPYVTKTYETNGLFCVAEYVTLISYDEFTKQKMRILNILDILSSEYLLGDMGWTKKNYCNWGYRQNSKDLVILDYGHMMKIDQNKMICTECGSFLSYNSTYTEIECMSCHKKIDFMTMKSKISKREEIQMIDDYLNKSIKTTDKVIEIDDNEFVVEEEVNNEDVQIDEMVSNQFELFKTRHDKKFSDLIDGDYVYVNDDEEELPDFSKLAKEFVEKPQKIIEDENNSIIDKIKDIRDPILKELMLIDDREDAEFVLSQYMILDKIDINKYNYYMNQLSRYYDGETQDNEGLSTIEEIVKSKKITEEEEVKEEPEDSYMEYYKMLYNKNESQEISDVESSKEEDAELLSQMKKMLYIDDDPEDLFPEDFIEKNRETLGFDVEDSLEDEERYDKVLQNIKNVNHTSMDELEDIMMEEDEIETDNIESYQEMILQVIDPENESDTKQEEIEEPENVINLNKQVNDNVSGVFKVHRNQELNEKNDSGVFKVHRNQDLNEKNDSGVIKVQKSESESDLISNDISESDIKVEKTTNDMMMVVNEPKEELTPMEKVFKQMTDIEN